LADRTRRYSETEFFIVFSLDDSYRGNLRTSLMW
jgi:hypothetical protein